MFKEQDLGSIRGDQAQAIREFTRDLVEKVRAEEREACLKILAEGTGGFQDQHRNTAVKQVLAQRAAIIRARG
jgi:hypothetical protein